MSDEFQSLSQSPLTPSEDAFAVSPDDVAALPKIPKYLYVGIGGDVVLRTMDSDEDVVFTNLPSASYLYLRAAFVRATGTTAGNIVACA